MDDDQALPFGCPKCGRELAHWPLERGGGCAPADWAHCIRRNDWVVAS